MADLNRDRKLDLAVCNLVDDNVSILLGRGDGTFEPSKDYAAGHHITGLAIGDLDGDGNAEIAVAEGTVGVFRGHGDGTFGERRNYGTPGASYSLAIADMNEDGKPDLVATWPPDKVSILLNIGPGVSCPGPFALLAPAADDTLYTTRPQLRWQSACAPECSVPVSYRVYWSGDAGFDAADSAEAGTDTTYVFPPDILSLQHTYSWRVKAHIPQGASRLCDPPEGRSFFLQDDQTPVLPRVAATAGTDGILISWRFPDEFGFTRVDLLRCAEGSEFSSLARNLPAGAGLSTFLDVNVQAGVSYQYEIEAFGPGGSAGRFGPVSAVADAPASLAFHVAPNPGTGLMKVSLCLPRDSDVVLRVFDSQGREVARRLLSGLRAGTRRAEWAVRDAAGHPLSRGSYYVRAETAGGRKTERWMIAP
jgi:hypothetical protein